MSPPPIPVDRLDPPPDPDVFAATWLAPDEHTFRPVILAGASPRTTPEQLRTMDPDAEVVIAIQDAGDTFGPASDGDARFHHRYLPFAEALQLVCCHDPGVHYYIRRVDLARLPTVRAQVPAPRWLEPASNDITFIWIGQAGVVSPLHLDVANNFFCQLHGRKRVRLYAPDDSRCMYPLRVPEVSHFSAVDVEVPDLARHARFAEATCFEAMLEPGDLLFLPAYWWHHVTSLDLGISISFMSPPAPWQQTVRAKWLAAVADPNAPTTLPQARWDHRPSTSARDDDAT